MTSLDRAQHPQRTLCCRRFDARLRRSIHGVTRQAQRSQGRKGTKYPAASRDNEALEDESQSDCGGQPSPSGNPRSAKFLELLPALAGPEECAKTAPLTAPITPPTTAAAAGRPPGTGRAKPTWILGTRSNWRTRPITKPASPQGTLPASARPNKPRRRRISRPKRSSWQSNAQVQRGRSAQYAGESR